MYKKSLQIILVLCILGIITQIHALDASLRFYDKEIIIYGKIKQLTDYPKILIGVETTNDVLLQIVGEKAGDLESFKDKYLKINGYLSNPSIYTKYTCEPVSWQEISNEEFELFKNKVSTQLLDPKIKTTKTKKWARLLRDFEISIKNNASNNINIIYSQLDIYTLPSLEPKRWFFGKQPDILPSKEVIANSDFKIKWCCDKLRFVDNEEMKYDVKVAYLDNNNILGIYRVSLKNTWESMCDNLITQVKDIEKTQKIE